MWVFVCLWRKSGTGQEMGTRTDEGNFSTRHSSGGGRLSHTGRVRHNTARNTCNQAVTLNTNPLSTATSAYGSYSWPLVLFQTPPRSRQPVASRPPKYVPHMKAGAMPFLASTAVLALA